MKLFLTNLIAQKLYQAFFQPEWHETMSSTERKMGKHKHMDINNIL